MTIPLAVDAELVVALAAVAWLEGVRRVPPIAGEPADVLLLRRSALGAWRALHAQQWNGLHVASWWAPCVSSVTLPLDHAPDSDMPASIRVARARRRLARVAGFDRVLRALGLALLLTVVVITPVAAFTYGMMALIRSVLIVVQLVLLLSLTTLFALRVLGFTWSSALRAVLPLLSPFSAPRACEVVWRAALESDQSPSGVLVAVRAALGDASFVRWARPLAFDALNGASTASDPVSNRLSAAFIATFGATYARELVSHCPRDPDDVAASAYCPRCGTVFGLGINECSDCIGVSLQSLELGNLNAGVAGSRRGRTTTTKVS